MNNANTNNRRPDEVSRGYVINSIGDQLHLWRDETYILQPWYLVNDAYIATRRAQGIVRPVVAHSLHGMTRAALALYRGTATGEEDGIVTPYRTDRGVTNLPYGVCEHCGYQIPRGFCATWVRENRSHARGVEEVDLCITCVPGGFAAAVYAGNRDGPWYADPEDYGL
jgi:hypothetical protein